MGVKGIMIRIGNSEGVGIRVENKDRGYELRLGIRVGNGGMKIGVGNGENMDGVGNKGNSNWE